MTSSDNFYSLGRFCFNLESQDPELKRWVEQFFVLPAQNKSLNMNVHCLNLDAPESITPNWKRHEFGDGRIDLIKVIEMRAIEHHAYCLWLDAAVLVKDNKSTILISGESHSGKTTSSFALSVGYNWKIVAEDIALIDLKSDRVIAFAAPQSVRPGTWKRVQDALNIDLPRPIAENWALVHDRCASSDPPASFDHVFHLSYTDSENPGSFEYDRLSPPAYIRKILKNSNLIQMNAIDKFASYVRSASCYQLQGGSLAERLDMMNKVLS